MSNVARLLPIKLENWTLEIFVFCHVYTRKISQ